MTPLTTLTLGCIIWSLWIRRHTWVCKWEQAATLNILLQGLALFLVTPLSGRTVGKTLCHLTHIHNLDDYIAHNLYLIALGCVVYHILSRLGDDEDFKYRFDRHILRPATLILPLLLALYMMGSGSHKFRPEFFKIPRDHWLTSYWLLLVGTVIYLMVYSCLGLLALNKDKTQRRMVAINLVGLVSGIIACVVRMVTLFLHIDIEVWVQMFGDFGAIGFSVSSARSWMVKSKLYPREKVAA